LANEAHNARLDKAKKWLNKEVPAYYIGYDWRCHYLADLLVEFEEFLMAEEAKRQST